jgi:hypothetical protein
MLYVPEGVQPPDVFELVQVDLGEPVKFVRLSDVSLDCGETFKADDKGKLTSTGRCGNFDCHRLELGKCRCGRHSEPVPFSSAL